MNTQSISPDVHPGTRILAAEDHPVNRRLMEFIFADLGCELKLVNDGQRVLDEMRQSKFDLVLLDLQMPELDGFETACAIHQEFGDSAPRVFAISADQTDKTRVRCKDSHIEELLPKPISEDDIAKVLRREYLHKDKIEEIHVESWVLPANFEALASFGNWDRVHKILRIFLQDGTLRMEKLMRALHDRDLTSISQLTHSLRGSAGQIGAGRFAKLCGDLEDYSKEAGHISVKRMLAVVKEFEKVEQLIEGYLEKVVESNQ